MTEKVISVILLIILLCLVFLLPKAMRSSGASKTTVAAAQTTTKDMYADLDVLTEFPEEAVFPKDYILVYERSDKSQIVIIEKEMNYLVMDTSEDNYGGLLVTNEDGKYYFRNLLSGGKWSNSGLIQNKDSSYMENELTKDRWEYPKKFVKDFKEDFKDSGKNIYVDEAQEIAGVKCNHYIIRSAWFEYNYWVDPKTNITLKYSKLEVRFGERNTVFEIKATKFSTKPSFSGYIPEDIMPE